MLIVSLPDPRGLSWRIIKNRKIRKTVLRCIFGLLWHCVVSRVVLMISKITTLLVNCLNIIIEDILALVYFKWHYVGTYKFKYSDKATLYRCSSFVMQNYIFYDCKNFESSAMTVGPYFKIVFVSLLLNK